MSFEIADSSAKSFSEWRGKELWWNIEGNWVSDKDLRNWCYHNMPDTWKYVEVVRQIQIDAYASQFKAEEDRPDDPTAWEGGFAPNH